MTNISSSIGQKPVQELVVARHRSSRTHYPVFPGVGRAPSTRFAGQPILCLPKVSKKSKPADLAVS